MTIIRSLIAALTGLFVGNDRDKVDHKTAREKEAGIFEGTATERSRDFDNKYNSATQMLKYKMDAKFPDNFKAKLGSETKNLYDYGADRAGAVDTMSIAIAIALRNGATVKQAADAGAASVGI